MNDQEMVKVMQSLGLDYSSAIKSTKDFEKSIDNLDKQLAHIKNVAGTTVKDINAMFNNINKINKPIEISVMTDKAEKAMTDFAQSMGIKLDKELKNQFRSLSSGLLTGNFNQADFDNLASGITDAYSKASQKYSKSAQIKMFADTDDMKIYDYLRTSTIKLDQSTLSAKKNVDGFSHAIRNLAKQSKDSGLSLDQMSQELEGMGIQGFGANTDDIAQKMTVAVENIRNLKNGFSDLGDGVPKAEIDNFVKNSLSELISSLAQINYEAKETKNVIDGIDDNAESFKTTNKAVDEAAKSIQEFGVVNKKTFKDAEDDVYKFVETVKDMEKNISTASSYSKNEDGMFELSGTVIDDKSSEKLYKDIEKAHTEAIKINKAIDETILKQNQMVNDGAWKQYFQGVSKTSDEIQELNNHYKELEMRQNKIKMTELENLQTKAASIQQRVIAKDISQEYSKQATLIRQQLSVLQDRLKLEGRLSNEEIIQTNELREQLDILNAQSRTAVYDTTKSVDNEYNIAGSEFSRRTNWFLSGTLFFGALRGAKEAITTIKDVEMGMVEIARVMEDSTFVFENYRDELLKLGVDYGQSFGNVQDIALRWAQAGYGVADSLDNTKSSLLALNTAELDAKNATESMIGIMAQWELTSKDLPLLLDIINKTADDYTVTSQDLIEGLLKSSEVSKNFGLTLEQNIALLTVMREASGATGKEIGNALKSILVFTQRDQSINVFKSLGISSFTDELETEFRPAWDIFHDIASKWDTASMDIQEGFIAAADDAGLMSDEISNLIGMGETWTDVQKRDIAQGAAGAYRRNYFVSLIRRLSDAQGVLNNMTDASGYSMRENERTMDTLEKKYQSLKTSAEQLAVALGDAGLLDLLKDIVDTGTDVTSAIASIDDEAKVLLTTALELVAVIGSIKAISGLFTDKNLLLGAGALLPGWTKLLVIIPSIIAAVSLYANNLQNADKVVKDFTERQESLTKGYNSEIEAIEETKNSMLGEAKTAEMLAEKIDTLSQKEELNIAEKEQLKTIVDQLNNTFPNLSLAIDEQTGKVIGNTTAVYDNIAALREQAIAQAYQAKMQATANSYVEQELELQRVRDEINKTQGGIYVSQGKQVQAEINAQAEIEQMREKQRNQGKPQWYIMGEEAKIRKKYGITDALMDTNKSYDALNSLKEIETEYVGLLEGLDAELEGWMDKVTETANGLGGNTYTPTGTSADTSGSGSTSVSGSYKNAALENALKVLDYKRYINELTLEDELKTLYEIKANHVNTADELMDINKRIYTAEQKLLDEKKNSYRLEESNIQHMAKLGVYSVEQQIEAYKELYSIKAESLADEQNRVENLFNLYKQLLSEEQKKVKEAYDERIDLIDEEAKRKKENLEDEKKSIQEQMDLLDRKDNERSYEQTMQGLQDELKYWQVRTSEEARKKVIEIQEQLDEEKYKHELEKQKESLQDKIDVLDDEIDEVERTADEEKKKWEKSYKQIEKAFDTHSTNIVALAGAMSKEAYQEWVNNYLTPLSSALSSGNFDMFDNLSGGLDSSIGGLNPGYGQNYVLVNADGTSNAKAGDIVVTGGGLYKKNADGTSTKVGDLSGGSTSDYNKVIEEYNNLIPKFHNGGKLLTDGLLIGKKQEMVLTPDLSLKMEGLLNFLKGNTTFNKNSSSTAYDNRKEVKIGNLVNIENNHMEDEVDSNIFARELSRQLANL